jgi:hypothetical protein
MSSVSSEKLMTNGQGISLSQVGRAKKVSSSKIQEREKDLALVLEAIRDGRSISFGPVPTDLVYPDWVAERLTPDLEVTKVTNPGEVKLWLDPRQESENKPTGHEVYEAHGDRLKKALSFGNLKWYEENPDQIPAEWREKNLMVYGWASVLRGACGHRFVPSLYCYVVRPVVQWCRLDYRWLADGPSGLLASSTKN